MNRITQQWERFKTGCLLANPLNEDELRALKIAFYAGVQATIKAVYLVALNEPDATPQRKAQFVEELTNEMVEFAASCGIGVSEEGGQSNS